MANKKLTDDVVKLRYEMVDFIVQSVKTQANAGYYNEEQVAELTKQTERVAKFLGLRK